MSSDRTASFGPSVVVTPPPIPCLILQAQRGLVSVGPRMVPLRGCRAVRFKRGKESQNRLHFERSALEFELHDLFSSSPHAILSLSEGRWRIEDLRSKNGTFVNGERIGNQRIEDGDVLELGSTFFVFRSALPAAFVEDIEAREARSEPVETYSLRLHESYTRLAQLTTTSLAVLIRGENGTGKELAARRLHEVSRRSGRFVAVNCAALPSNLVESELFGYTRGAFTGAEQSRPGLIQTADQGTLFLDEIAELEPSAQAKLLRVLEQREVVPVGGREAVPVDIQLVSATWQDLGELAAESEFRLDLFARLSGSQLNLPPLRERREDFGLLNCALFNQFAGRAGATLTYSREALRAALVYSWPRNIRQLRQVLESALAANSWGEILPNHLPVEVQSPAAKTAGDSAPPSPASPELRERVSDALHRHRGNVSAIAREFGKERVQIRRWCNQLGLDPDQFRDKR